MHARWDWLEANFFDPSFGESTFVVKATFTSRRKRLTNLFWEVLNTCMKDRMSRVSTIHFDLTYTLIQASSEKALHSAVV